MPSPRPSGNPTGPKAWTTTNSNASSKRPIHPQMAPVWIPKSNTSRKLITPSPKPWPRAPFFGESLTRAGLQWYQVTAALHCLAPLCAFAHAWQPYRIHCICAAGPRPSLAPTEDGSKVDTEVKTKEARSEGL